MRFLRVNMNVAIVAMVNQTAINEGPNTIHHKAAYCISTEASNSTAYSNSTKNEKLKYIEGSFIWTTEQQGLILGSFYYGYLFTQIPGGWAASRFGAKWIMGLSVFGTAILNLVTPLASKIGSGFEALIAIRVLEGFLQAVMFPAVHALMARWVPPLERSKIPAFVLSGVYVGAVFTFSCTGYLAASNIGWPLVFYVAGSIGCFWFIVWTVFVTSSPDTNRWITEEEKSYIIENINAEKSIRANTAASCGNVPWLEIAKSLPVIAIYVSGFSWAWSFYTILSDLPLYLRTILGFDIKANGIISSLPYLTAFLTQMFSGWFGDLLRSKKLLNTTHVRKLFDCSGNFLNAILMLSVTFVGCNRVAVVILLCTATGVGSFNMAGSHVNFLDIAPVYAGLLMGISNAIATIPGLITPSVVGALTYNDQTVAAWSKVFYISFGLNLFATIFYFIFGSGELQHWAAKQKNTKKEEIIIISSPKTNEILF